MEPIAVEIGSSESIILPWSVEPVLHGNQGAAYEGLDAWMDIRRMSPAVAVIEAR